MRYHHTSWSDVDRALEAFKYARRSLLVVMAVALPFAAWETAVSRDTTAKQDTVQVQPAAHPGKVVRPVTDVEPAKLVLPART